MTPLPADVLRRFHAGDRATLDLLVRRHTASLFQWMARFGIAGEDRDDVVQEAWVRVLRQPTSYSGVGSFEGWLYRVARNVAYDRLRSDASREERRQRLHREVGGRTESGSDRLPVEDGAERLLGQLSERQRQVVMLRVLEGMSTAEAARVMGCAPGTVKATLSQAFGKLRHVLEREHLDVDPDPGPDVDTDTDQDTEEPGP